MEIHDKDIQKFQEFLKSKNWKGKPYPTPIDHFLQRFGIQRPPPIFQSPLSVILSSGSFYGFFWFVFMHLFVPTIEVGQLAVRSFIGGFLFGLVMGFMQWRMKKKLGVTTWQEFISDENSK
jgi:hypothetical protein